MIKMRRQSKRTRQKNDSGDRKGRSNESPEIPDRGMTSDIPGLHGRATHRESNEQRPTAGKLLPLATGNSRQTVPTSSGQPQASYCHSNGQPQASFCHPPSFIIVPKSTMCYMTNTTAIKERNTQNNEKMDMSSLRHLLYQTLHIAFFLTSVINNGPPPPPPPPPCATTETSLRCFTPSCFWRCSGRDRRPWRWGVGWRGYA